MQRRGSRWAAAVAMCGLTIAVSGAADAAKRPKCEDRAGVTLDVGPELRVFKTVQRRGLYEHLRVFVCRPGHRSVRRLEKYRNSDDLTATPLRVEQGGPFAAIEWDFATGVSAWAALNLYDSRAKRKRQVASISLGEYYGDLDFGVTRHGGVAALVTNEGVGRLLAFDGAGRRLLSEAATALATEGDTVYWTEAGEPRSVVLTGRASGEHEVAEAPAG